jgi:hypothetical protein
MGEFLGGKVMEEILAKLKNAEKCLAEAKQECEAAGKMLQVFPELTERLGTLVAENKKVTVTIHDRKAQMLKGLINAAYALGRRDFPGTTLKLNYEPTDKFVFVDIHFFPAGGRPNVRTSVEKLADDSLYYRHCGTILMWIEEDLERMANKQKQFVGGFQNIRTKVEHILSLVTQ